ncbi:hypothetical protein HMI01_19460 [Halolactibacillus miurensis]|uniref:Predicted N-acyltransferase, GNAT family n=1 Tax=Halolactibacillus miurensis TaxID=306541 RepID=A0A1I6S2G4_9BACI|nr:MULTISPECIES: GNAT family N-acetyltransferase [Halolactibacillus]GEM04958.1 hypothetical protein HMI01_19460 [Halolactibacillus miurensis]SFS71119.1 Predicted N-acyltransferase, GNAT family [Halolactibacillus miurensis]
MNIIKATTEQQKQDGFFVRHDVFVKEQGVDASIERDELDKIATHIVGYVNDQPVACLRFTPNNNRGKIQRMAVLKAYRGQHLGKKLMLKTETFMRDAGLTISTLHAQKHATGFYQRLGYTITSDVFYEATIAHVAMEKTLS